VRTNSLGASVALLQRLAKLGHGHLDFGVALQFRTAVEILPGSSLRLRNAMNKAKQTNV
jgi:hypothetical protein